MSDLPGAAQPSYADLSWRAAIARLAKQVGVYGVGNALQRLGAFFLLPLYLRYLSPDEYGLLALVGVIQFVLPAVLLVGAPAAITRYYHEWVREQSAERNLWTVWAIGTGTALALTAGLHYFGEPFFRIVLKQVPFEPHGRLGLWWAFFSSLSLCPLMLLRIREHGQTYVTVSLLSFFLAIALNSYAVMNGWGVVGILRMQVVATACIGLWLSYWYVRQVRVSWSGAGIARIFRVSLPLVGAGLLEAVAGRADRFFLDKWVPLPEIGLYSLANQLGQGVKFFYDSVKPAWVPFYIRVAGERQDAARFLGRVAGYYVALLGCMAVAVLLFGPLVVAWFSAGSDYQGALPLLPLFVGSYLLQGLVPIGIMAIMVSERTGWTTVIHLVQLAVLIGANVLLTPEWGVRGAAWALVASYGVQGILYLWFGQMCYPVQLVWTHLSLLLGSVALVIAAMLWWPDQGIFAALILLVVYVVAALALLRPAAMGTLGGLLPPRNRGAA